MALDYGFEKFERAVDSLATSTGEWRDRLYSAFLAIHMVNPAEDVPPDLSKRAAKILSRFTGVEAEGDEGNYRATINQMDEHDSQRIMRELYEFNAVLQARQSEE